MGQRAAQIIETAHTAAQEVTNEAETLMFETRAECMRMGETVHEERRNITRIMKMVRDVVVRIGSKLGLDLIGQDLKADLDGIEETLAAAEELRPDAEDGPSF